MSTALRTRLWPRFATRQTSAVSSWRGRWERNTLVRLFAHFLARLVRAGDETDSTEFELGAGGLLGLLAMPGALASFLLLDKYFNSTLLDWFLRRKNQDIYLLSVPDKYLLLSLAMAVTGILTCLKWDRIVPDAQDYANVAPLPVRPRAVLIANFCAIAIAVGIVSVDVNAVSGILFPLFIANAAQSSLAALLQFAAVHAACTMLAGGFTFCAVFALLGTLAAVLPRVAFRAASAWVRGGLLVAFLVLLAGGYAGPTAVAEAAGRWIRYLPSFWFLGLYQNWQHRGTPALPGGLALPGTAGAFLLMVLSYGLTYRRRYAEALESSPPPSREPVRRLFLRFLDLFSPRGDGFSGACHRFVVRALLRNEAHRVALAVSIAFGWLLALQDLGAASDAGRLRAPYAAAYVLILGLRVAIEIPARVPAHWIFQAALNPRETESRGMVRQVMLGFVTTFVLLPGLAIGAWRWNWRAAALETACVAAFSLVLIEVLLAGYRKIPLTCPLPGFRDHFLLLCLGHILGFVLFTRIGAAVTGVVITRPLWFPLVPATLGAGWFWNRIRLQEAAGAGELEPGITFENVRRPAVERLKLFE
jgi:hypothetical protein